MISRFLHARPSEPNCSPPLARLATGEANVPNMPAVMVYASMVYCMLKTLYMGGSFSFMFCLFVSVFFPAIDDYQFNSSKEPDDYNLSCVLCHVV